MYKRFVESEMERQMVGEMSGPTEVGWLVSTRYCFP